MAKQCLYKVVFVNQNQVYELYVRQIYQSDLYGFIEIEERSATIERKPGLRIAQRAWLFGPDGGTSPCYRDGGVTP